jgi:hypothetical protein
MSKLWDEIADEWDGTATSSSTALVIVTGGAPTTPIAQPSDPRYGGMTPESARRSWLAAQESNVQDYTPDRFRWIDMSCWDGAPLPQRKWAIKDRVPLNQAGLFSGEGGTGKSIIELTKNVAHVAGKDWLGSLADAIAKAHILNENKLTAGIPIPQLDADAELHLAAFNRFCSQHGVRNCPARPQVVAAFIRAEEKFGTPPETIVLILSAIQLLHDRHGLASPIASAVVRAELERVLKTEAPRSWPRAEQLMFASLPPEIRAVVAKRERDRERWLRNKMNELAELKRQLTDGAAKPVTTQEETKK